MKSQERLKIARKLLGLTQEKFGEPLDINRYGVLGLESGKVKISTVHAKAFEYIYKISSDWLLNGTGEMFIEERLAKEATNGFGGVSEETSHAELIKYFTNKTKAKVMNWNLIKLEKGDFAGFNEVDEIIKLKLKLKGIEAATEATGLQGLPTDEERSTKQQGRGAGKQREVKKA